MIRLNNKYINWSLAIKELDGLYYDENDVNPIPACNTCSLQENCKYSSSNNILEHHRSCFRYTIKSTNIDWMNLYVDGCIAYWYDGVNKFMRGIKK